MRSKRRAGSDAERSSAATARSGATPASAAAAIAAAALSALWRPGTGRRRGSSAPSGVRRTERVPAPSGSHETSRHFAAGEKPNDTRRGWRDAAATAAARGWSMPKTSAREVRAMQSRNTRSNAATDGNRSTWSRSRFVRTVTAGEYRASVPSDSSASATRSGGAASWVTRSHGPTATRSSGSTA